MEDKKEVTVIPETAVMQGPMASAQILLEKNVDIEKIRDMIQLQKEFDAIQAEKAYTEAMAEFKKNPPKILKDQNVHFTNNAGRVTDYDHSSLGNVTQEINRGLSEHGFSMSFKTEQPISPIDPKVLDVKITCKITHRLGHSDSTALQGPPDTSGGKNPVQAVASTATLLERYTALALTGLATHGQDDDGRGGPPYNAEPEYVGEDEQSKIRDMLTSLDCDEQTFLGWLGCESIDAIDKKSYARAITNLKARIEEEKKNAGNN